MSDLKQHEILSSIFYPDLNCRDQIKMSALMRNFQQVGGRHLDAAGTPPEELLHRSVAFMLIRHEIKITAPITAGEYFFSTWVSGLSGVNFIRNYEMKDAFGQQLAIGSAAWIVYDLAARKVIRPDRFETDIPYNPEKQHGIAEPDKFKLPEGLEPVGKICPRFTDMDSNQHVNNAVYGDFAAEAAHLMGITRPIIRQKLYFRHETAVGECICLSAKQEDNRLFICGDAETDNRRIFEAELTFGL